MERFPCALSILACEEEKIFQAADRLIPMWQKTSAQRDGPTGGYPGRLSSAADLHKCRTGPTLESGVCARSTTSMMLRGDKIATAARLTRPASPSLNTVAFSPEGAVEAAEELGYPVVFGFRWEAGADF